MPKAYDFSGWASRNNLRCSDGRTIMKDAFKDNDGVTVPLVWNHNHFDPDNVLGHAVLENREDGIYTYGYFNNNPKAVSAKESVMHGDITGLSIYANQLQQQGGNVLHGNIREVSLVYASANPGAYIEDVIRHGEIVEDEMILSGVGEIHIAPVEEEAEELEHADKAPATAPAPAKEADDEDETVGDVLNTLTEKQRNVVMALIGKALESDEEDEDEEEKEDGGQNNMKHNAFENDTPSNSLSHAEVNEIFADAKRTGSLKDAVLAHTATYGIDPIGMLFPDYKSMTTTPEFIKREDSWVSKVMSGVHHTPFSRIKSVFADITADEARAKGYTKGNRKVEEVFTLLKRSTSPTTIYKKQKLDRDDIVDITDFDVVAWIRGEMRMMLDEEIARAILISDGRSGMSNDKIAETCIRPIWTDDSLYTIKAVIGSKDMTPVNKTKAFIKMCVRARKDYQGSGSPILFTTEDIVTECLLLEDTLGHRLYKSIDELATAIRVREIVTVPVMENQSRTETIESVEHTMNLAGLIVNLTDYNVGADKGGEVNMFDDFDINYNQQLYLIETRCSGALTKPFSAIAVEFDDDETVDTITNDSYRPEEIEG